MKKYCERCLRKGTEICHTCTQAILNKEIGLKSVPSQFVRDSAVVIKPDNVNHPSHYETGKFECIDVMVETQGVEAVKAFCLCNAFKYIYRHNGKNGVEDIKKAQWYINKYLELEGGNNDA